jgi:thiamine pyrophosphate-dependent acetolactate synthase large subunit-like protein
VRWAFIAVNYPKPVDFAGIASCFGIPSTRLGEESDPAAALDAALQAFCPHLIHGPVDVYDKVFPMVRPGSGKSKNLRTCTKVDRRRYISLITKVVRPTGLEPVTF